MYYPTVKLSGLMCLSLFVLASCTESEPVSDCLGVICDDQIGCTVDSCDEGTGECAYSPDNSLCGPADLCDPETGCIARPCEENSDCDDYRFCNGQESCASGECQEGEDPCDDGFSCTVDSCDEQEESSDGKRKSAKVSHRAIPTWNEAVGVIVATNLESREKRPGGGSSGGRRRGGRGRSPRKSK